MVTQYPHTATFTIKVPATQDSDGNWTPGSESSLQTECRLEPNGQGRTISGPDGKAVEFAWTMFIPATFQTKVSEGSPVSIAMEAETVTGEVIRHSHGQLNSRIWL